MTLQKENETYTNIHNKTIFNNSSMNYSTLGSSKTSLNNYLNTFKFMSSSVSKIFYFELKNIDYIKTIDHIICDGKTYQLKRELQIRICIKNNYYYLDNNNLDIHTCGKTYEECLRDLYDEIMFLKEQYKDADINEMSKSARALRKTIGLYI